MSLMERTVLLLGEGGAAKLENAHVIVFGLGGVGGYAAEALARSGIGRLTLVDADAVADSNRNRQLLALCSTVGLPKVEVAAERIRDINPACRVCTVQRFYLPDASEEPDFSDADYIVDAIDTVTAKLEILRRARAAGVRVISCMGTGNRLHPELLRLTTLDRTEGCPLARVMRVECRRRGLSPETLPVVYSAEPARRCTVPDTEGTGRHAPGSISFVPGVAGLMMAGRVIRDLTGIE
jgi:tRNA A37 threonylcarbamoyladenosine dehydratase